MSTDADFEKFVEEVKDKASMIEVIESLSSMRFQTKKVGRYVSAIHPDSFQVDEDWGIYTWFARAGSGGHQYETGDILAWMQRYANMDFMQACEWLAKRYGVSMPRRSQSQPESKEQKTRTQIYEIACAWLEAQLWANPAALDYCHRRGWTDETIREARLGFAPGMERVADLRKEFDMNEVNRDDPAAVSLCGRRGGVAAWIKAQGITDYSDDWVTNDFVPGLATGLRLVYPHIWRGRVTYFSARNLERFGDRLINRPEKDENGGRHAKSYNLPRCLVGERMRYFNSAFTRGADNCLVVEGQADAISAAQVGLAAIALVGVAPDADLAGLVSRYAIKRVYVGLDADQAGRKNQIKAAEVFGPLTRLVTWPEAEQAEPAEEGVDAIIKEG